MENSQQVNQQIQVKASDEVLKGVYSNVIRVGHTREEFFLDFLNIFPPAGIATARVIVSPSHMKRILATLDENLKSYEKEFGELKAEGDKLSPTTNTSSSHSFGFDTNKAV